MSIRDKLKEIIRELIKQELPEASVTGNIDGGEGPPKTPYAFGKKKKKEDEISTNSTGYTRVNESGRNTKQLLSWVKDIQKRKLGMLKATIDAGDWHAVQEIGYTLKDIGGIIIKLAIKAAKANESITEGKYHDYRNDESMTPKQKIGQSMREVRDGLNHLEKLVKMNIRLKNELKVDSDSYWKNTHRALHKISERLVKLANKVGQLQ
jgi:hypothetical protein